MAENKTPTESWPKRDEVTDEDPPDGSTDREGPRTRTNPPPRDRADSKEGRRQDTDPDSAAAEIDRDDTQRDG